MLVSTQRSLAMRCPLCGRLEINQISLFDFAGRTQLHLSCSCGFERITFNIKKGKAYSLQLPCLICEEVHLIRLSREEMWQQPLIVLSCNTTGQELGYLGTDDAIRQLVKKKHDDLESIINDLGFDDYFTNPQVMFETLSHLHQIAEASKLYCACGNPQIDVEVFPEKLELHCPLCQSLHIIYAENIEDLRMIKQTDLIAMTEKGFTSFNSSKLYPIIKP